MVITAPDTTASSPRAFKSRRAAALTHPGMRRRNNEDSFAVVEELGLYLVADGMGGHARGEVASQLAIDTLIAALEEEQERSGLSPASPGWRQRSALIAGIHRANAAVIAAARDEDGAGAEGMGTTLAAVKLAPDELFVAHVGDSRVYCWRPDGSLEQLTRDHSYLNHLADEGALPPDTEQRGHRFEGLLVRAIGRPHGLPTVTSLPRRPGDVLLLCSDGLSDLVDAASIEAILAEHSDDLERTAERLVEEANDRGGRDNVTVLLLRVDEAD